MTLIKKNRGFTLIELMLAMAIIAVLLRITIPSFRAMQQEATITRAQGDLHTLKIAIESYYLNHNRYPYPDQTLAPLGNIDILYQQTLLSAQPQILSSLLGDAFWPATLPTGDPYGYGYNTSPDNIDPTTKKNSKFYVIYSAGPDRNGNVDIDEKGKITLHGRPIYETNGYL